MPSWDPDAIDDLMRIVEYIAEDDPATAWRVHDEIYGRAAVLDDQPLIGRKGETPGTREFVLTGTPFILVYDPEPSPVVWRVLHGAQKWPQEKQEAVNG